MIKKIINKITRIDIVFIFLNIINFISHLAFNFKFFSIIYERLFIEIMFFSCLPVFLWFIIKFLKNQNNLIYFVNCLISFNIFFDSVLFLIDFFY